MRFAPILPVALVVLTGLTQQNAEAQDLSEMAELAESIPLGKLGLNVADRLRRSIAIGPFVGAHATLGDSGEDGGLGVSFGVGLSTFDIPILPDGEEIKRLLSDRFKTLFREKVKEALTHGKVTSDKLALRSIAKEVWKDVIDAYLNERQHRMLETPSLRIHAEAVKLVQLEAWQVRGSIAKGLGNMSFGLTFGFDDSFAFVGPEVSVQLLFGKARSPILDLFARADIPLGEKNGPVDISLGARFILDVL